MSSNEEVKSYAAHSTGSDSGGRLPRRIASMVSSDTPSRRAIRVCAHHSYSAIHLAPTVSIAISRAAPGSVP